MFELPLRQDEIFSDIKSQRNAEFKQRKARKKAVLG